MDHGIHVVSYACDGTEVERAVQHHLVEQAALHVTYIFKHPADYGFPSFTLKIPLYGQTLKPIVMVQDSKHFGKTLRNNDNSGARLLVMGNYVSMYSFTRDMAFDEDSPLYHRDVEKSDQQDNNSCL